MLRRSSPPSTMVNGWVLLHLAAEIKQQSFIQARRPRETTVIVAVTPPGNRERSIVETVGPKRQRLPLQGSNSGILKSGKSSWLEVDRPDHLWPSAFGYRRPRHSIQLPLSGEKAPSLQGIIHVTHALQNRTSWTRCYALGFVAWDALQKEEQAARICWSH